MLKNPRATFTFGRADFEFEPVMRFREMGAVTMKYLGTETRQHRATRRYSIGGPGLRDTTGTWWADAATGTLVEFEIPIPDEPGFNDVRVVLLAQSRITAEQWEARKRTSLCGK